VIVVSQLWLAAGVCTGYQELLNLTRQPWIVAEFGIAVFTKHHLSWVYNNDHIKKFTVERGRLETEKIVIQDVVTPNHCRRYLFCFPQWLEVPHFDHANLRLWLQITLRWSSFQLDVFVMGFGNSTTDCVFNFVFAAGGDCFHTLLQYYLRFRRV